MTSQHVAAQTGPKLQEQRMDQFMRTSGQRKAQAGKKLIDYRLPAEQRPWRVQFDEMHICLAALTVHLLRLHLLFYML